MIPDKLMNVLDIEKLKLWIYDALKKAEISTIETLKNDERILLVSEKIYKKIPLLPYRATIKATIGKNGFIKLIFYVRDKMLELNSVDLNWLNREFIESKLDIILKDRVY